jgi:hypothetical protein
MELAVEGVRMIAVRAVAQNVGPRRGLEENVMIAFAGTGA